MPSGAKKRKAAKRKGTHPNTNDSNPSPSASTHDVKHQDGRQSGVGEASSTTSQDNPSHHDLSTEGEEEKIENSQNASQVEGVSGIVVEGNSDVPVEREFKNGNEFGGKFVHDETERKSYDGGPSGSSSSSDDESHGDKNSLAAVDTVSTVAIVEASEAAVDCVPPVVSDKASDLKTLAEETDERLSLSYNAPIATHDKGADLVKDSGVTEPLLVPPPRPMKTTSWKGCCGLFELFTDSDR
ncbi:hypothetical protein AAHA92_05170 [Salvia divinorum]|uniref:Uncharacterized protein n=1 Tax=Salvia divinorum TaxID=28513 RepID=A0ABD1I1K7_SALDI